MVELAAVLEWVGGLPWWAGVCVLAVSAGVEYLFPPFPGDTVTLAGALLIPLAGWPWWGVLGGLVCGSLWGAALMWRVGVWAASGEGDGWVHRWLRREGVSRRVSEVVGRFERHGAVYIVLNRFIPAFRGVFFIASGMAGLRLGVVLWYAALSALLWNGVLLGVGALVGFQLDRIVELSGQYARGVWIALCVGVAVWGLRWWWRRRSPNDR